MTPAEAAVLAADLASGSQAPVEIHGEEFEALLRWSQHERMIGVLVTALEHRIVVVGSRNDGHLDAFGRAREAHRTALRITLAAEATAVHAVRVLRRAGVEPFVFKGSATAHLDYADPALRTFHDADLHVDRSDFGAAIDALVADGFRRSPTVLSSRWERRFARACELKSPDGVELDLHAAVATGYFGERLAHDRLRATPDRVWLGGEEISAFSLPARALISCYGVVLSRGPGRRLERDLLQQLRHLGDRWPEMVSLGGDDGAAVISAAIGSISGTAGSSVFDPELVEWAGSVTPGPRARQALHLAEQAWASGWSADARSTMLALSPWDRVGFGVGVAASSVRRHRWIGLGRFGPAPGG